MQIVHEVLRILSPAKVWTYCPHWPLTSVLFVTVPEPLQPETTPLMWLGPSRSFFLWQDSSASTMPFDTDHDGFQESPTQHFETHTNGPSLGSGPRRGAQISLASGCLAVNCKPRVHHPLDVKILRFGAHLSKLTCLLVTTRGIPHNVIKIIISVEQSQLRQPALAWEAPGLSLWKRRRGQG